MPSHTRPATLFATALCLGLVACGDDGSSPGTDAGGQPDAGYPPCGAPQEIGTVPDGDVVYENLYEDPACVDYLVPEGIGHLEGTLEIAAGVRMAFAENSFLIVHGDSRFIADGTQEQPIVFTGTEAVPGHWMAIMLHSTEPEHVLDWVTVEYGGGEDVEHAANLEIGTAGGGATASITHTTLRHSAAYGLRQDLNATLTAFTDNVVTDNALAPVLSYTHYAHMFDASSSYAGNGIDGLALEPREIGAEVRWQALDVPYLVQEDTPVELTIRGTLSLDPGVTITFADGIGMAVRDSGVLSAVGTAERPITLTGAEAERGHWAGLAFSDAPSGENRLEHVIVEYGGAAAISTGEPANLAITQTFGGATQVSIANTTLRQSSSYGLYARAGTVIQDGGGNQLTGNALGPAYVDAEVAHQLLPASNYLGNDRDEISIGVEAAILEQDRTWHDLGVPFVLRAESSSSGLLVDGVSWTLEPGVELSFEQGIGVRVVWSEVRGPGSLVAIGEQDNRISLAGKDGATWLGLDSTNSTISLAYASIRDGGSGSYSGEDPDARANVTVRSFLTSRPDSVLDVGDGVS